MSFKRLKNCLQSLKYPYNVFPFKETTCIDVFALGYEAARPHDTICFPSN